MKSTLFSLLFLSFSLVSAAEPFRFPEGKHGQGELKYINGLPVLVVAGKPEEIGAQMGTLALKPAAGAVRVFKDYLKKEGLEVLWPVLVKVSRQQFAKFPAEYQREVEAIAKASGVERDLLIVANTIEDLRKLAGCSGLVVEPGRSASGATLFGRNWDFMPLENLHAYSLVTVYRPAGKRAFVTVGFPGVITSASAMNADGFAFGGNEVRATADGSDPLDLKGVPASVVGRRLLEECGTLADAEKWLRANRPASMVILVACDKTGGAVFESTTKNLHVRRATEGLCIGTNHFVSKELAVQKVCRRYQALSEAAKVPKLSVADVSRRLHAAHQGAWTLQSMVFEPTAGRLHLAFSNGKDSATTRPLQTLDLKPLFK